MTCYDLLLLLTTETLSEDLAKWSSKSKMSQNQLNELLNILKRSFRVAKRCKNPFKTF